jgi:hypothetical protein
MPFYAPENIFWLRRGFPCSCEKVTEHNEIGRKENSSPRCDEALPHVFIKKHLETKARIEAFFNLNYKLKLGRIYFEKSSHR